MLASIYSALPDIRSSLLKRTLLAIAIILCAFVLRTSLPIEGLPFLFFLPATMVASFASGAGPSIISVLLSTSLAFLFFVQSPMSGYHTREQWMTLVLYVIATALISWVCIALRKTLTAREADIVALAASDQKLQEVNILLKQQLDDQSRDLHASEKIATAYFDLSPDYLLLIRVDPEDRVTFEDINPAAEAVFKRKRTDLVGVSPSSFLPQESTRDIEHYARTCYHTGQVQPYSVRRNYTGTEVIIDAVVAPIRHFDSGGGLVLFSGRDVTAQRKTEDALRQSQKMEAVGQLTGGIAHDFNNLLTAILGSLDLLQRRITQGRVGEVERYIIAAQLGAKRAAALTHRLLAFSRRQTLDPKPTNVVKLITGMMDLFRRTVGPEITIENVDMVGLWTALVDPNQLENALLNLAINARDAMPDGGRLTIETGNKWMDDRSARERDLAPGQYLSVCVSDTGTGMLAETIDRAFDPFFTTKPFGLGTGLGLSMIYGFARQSGGHVRIYSEVGQGTMVCIYLPRHYGTEDVAEAASLQQPDRAEQGETVLVVDDEPTIRMLVSDVLADFGYAAIEAEDGAAGLKILRSSGRVDLLVTDVGLPGGMNGRQVADAARALRPDLKVLFITGYAENAAVGNGHLDPGMAVLTKPFGMDDLARKIRDLIEN